MDISIIIPVYNSITSLSILLDEIEAFFCELKLDYEIIFVNDCSSQETYDELERLKCKERPLINHNSELSVIHLEKNLGQQKALAVGLQKARGEFALTMDDDLQHNIEAFNEMYACLLYTSRCV